MQIEPAHCKPFQLKDFAQMEEERRLAELAVMQAIEAAKTPIVPTFSEAEIMAAKQQGFADGFSQGHAKGRAEIDREQEVRELQLTQVLQMVAQGLGNEIGVFRKHQAAHVKYSADVVLMVARKLAGQALESQPLAAIEGMVSECIEMLMGKAQVTLVVHPDLSELLQNYLTTHVPVTEKMKLIIVGDAKLAKGDCRIEWPGGAAERHTEALWQEMETVIKRAFEISANKVTE